VGLHSSDQVFAVCVPFAADVKFLGNLLLDLWSIQVEDLVHVLDVQSFIGIILAKEVESHAQSVRRQYVSFGLVKGEVTLMNVEFPRQVSRLLALESPVDDLRQLV
jgi:hypothetical protein